MNEYKHEPPVPPYGSPERGDLPCPEPLSVVEGAWTGWTAQDNADALLGAVDNWYEEADYGFTVEASVCDTLRAERDSARLWAMAYEQRIAEAARLAADYLSTHRQDTFGEAIAALLSAPLGAPEQVQG